MLEIEFLVPLRKKKHPGTNELVSIKMVTGVPRSDEDGVPVFLLAGHDIEKRIMVLSGRLAWVPQENIGEIYRACGVVCFFDESSGFPMYFSKKVIKRVRDLETGEQLYPEP